MFQRPIAAAIFSLLLAGGHLAAQSQGTPNSAATTPDSLIQYVRQARKAGLGETQIEKNAQTAGWSAETVKNAMARANAPAQPDPSPAPAAAAPRAGAPGTGAPAAAAAAKAASEPTKPAVREAAPGPSSAGVSGGSPQAGAAPEIPKDRKAPDDYEIGAGDVLRIAVWKEPDASVPSVVVRPDGKISMPLLKEVPVLGLTVVQAEQLITQQLSKFLTAPDVTVVVEAINSKKIYIIGAVKKEGPIPFTYQMTVLQAISEAGGLTDYAKRKKIYVLHNENGRQFTFPFDYDAVLRGQRMELNVRLMPGDTVVVPH